MRVLTAGLALVLVAMALAGCVSIGGEDPSLPDGSSEERTGEEIPQALAFVGCREQVGLFTLPADAFEDELPPGFEPRGLEGDDQTGLLTVYAWACDETHVEGLDEEPVTEMVATLSVHPPQEHETENASAYAAILHGVTTRTDLMPLYDAWGLPFEQGDVEMTTQTDPTDTLRAGHASSTTSSQTILNTNVGGPVESREAGQARFFGVQEARLTAILEGWWADVPAYQQGQATLLPDDALPPSLGITPDAAPLEGLGVHYYGDGFAFGYDNVPQDREA